MRRHHLKYRGKNGRTTQAGALTRNIGRWKSTAKMRVKKERVDQYLELQKKRVGKLKASWLPALVHYATLTGATVRVSAWIKRHRGSGAYGGTISNTGTGSITASSTASHNTAIRPGIIKWIQGNRQRQMKRYSERRMQQIADQFNSNRATVLPIRGRST
jgi:hypothetical protein